MCVCVFWQQLLVQTGFVIDQGIFFLMIFMFKLSSLRVSFCMLESRWLRKCPIFT